MIHANTVLVIDGPIPVGTVPSVHIKWDSETVLPSGAIIRKAKGFECFSTPLHTDGWNP